MHNESLMVAGVLAVVAVFLTSRKNSGAKAVGLIFASAAGLMLIAGVSA